MKVQRWISQFSRKPGHLNVHVLGCERLNAHVREDVTEAAVLRGLAEFDVRSALACRPACISCGLTQEPRGTKLPQEASELSDGNKLFQLECSTARTACGRGSSSSLSIQ